MSCVFYLSRICDSCLVFQIQMALLLQATGKKNVLKLDLNYSICLRVFKGLKILTSEKMMMQNI